MYEKRLAGVEKNEFRPEEYSGMGHDVRCVNTLSG